MNLLSFAAKESSKERPLLAICSASQKRARRCYPSALFNYMALVFCLLGGLLLSFFLSCQLTFPIQPYQACLGAKKGAIMG
jgi:hypothetical protein